ncbi:MAG: hypothetical protein C4B57_00250 [Deltaproteobacteria bacterium]|nr:MAG: hypothetical protein C4B57_00250 [Deltaproteobacteria bacterium]
MVKEARKRLIISFSGLFFWQVHKKRTRRFVMYKKGIISYRRRCKRLGQNTGLSHYIMLTSKTKKK